MKDDQSISRDIEGGSIDSGLAENVTIQAERVTRQKRDKEIDDPTREINFSGVGIMNIDD